MLKSIWFPHFAKKMCKLNTIDYVSLLTHFRLYNPSRLLKVQFA